MEKKRSDMELAAKLAVMTELDVNALIETEADEVQWLLHCALLFASHSWIFLPLLLCISMKRIPY